MTEQECSSIRDRIKQLPPVELERLAEESMAARDEQGSAKFRLDALTEAAHAAGIPVERSQIRRIYVQEGVGFRQRQSWGTSNIPDFVGS